MFTGLLRLMNPTDSVTPSSDKVKEVTASDSDEEIYEDSEYKEPPKAVLKPDDADVHYKKGLALHVLGRYNDAIAFYDAALKITPNCALTHMYKGEALLAKGHFAEALESFTAALKIDPKYVYALNGKANALYYLNQWREAEACFSEVLQVNPSKAQLDEMVEYKKSHPDYLLPEEGKQLAHSKLQQQLSLDFWRGESTGKAKKESLTASAKADEKTGVVVTKSDAIPVALGVADQKTSLSDEHEKLLQQVSELKNNYSCPTLHTKKIDDQFVIKLARIIADKPYFTTLFIVHNSIGSEGAKALAASKYLTDLHMRENNIGTLGAKALAASKSITKLEIEFNNIGDDGAKALAANVSITELNIQSNNIGSEGAKVLAILNKAIIKLNLSNNNIGDEGVEVLATNRTLKSLSIGDNNISIKGIRALASNTTLSFLTMCCVLKDKSKLGNKEAEVLAGNTTLVELRVGWNVIGDEGAAALAANRTLKCLDLARNKIGDNGAKALAANSTLTSLDLGNNLIGDESAVALAANRTLKSLDLQSNKIGNNGAKALAANSTLTSLNLGSNLIGDEGAKAFLNNETLTALYLHGNNISESMKFQLEERIKKNKELKAKQEWLAELRKQEGILKEYQHDANAHYSKGCALSGLGRYSEAIACFDATLKINSNNANAHYSKAIAFKVLCNYSDAITSCDAALKINPNCALTHMHKGEALLAKGQHFAEALESFTAALKIDPKYVYALNGKANALYYLNQWREAEACFSEVLQVNPSKAQLDEMVEYKKSHPDYLLPEEGKQLSHLKLQQQSQAIESKENFPHKPLPAPALSSPQSVPHHPVVADQKAPVESENEKWLAELQKQETILKQNPNDTRAHYDKGEALYHLGRGDESIVCYDIVLKINPNHARACHGKACALFVLGRYDKAIAFYDDVLKVNPNDWLIHYYKGCALKSLNRYDDAITSYDASLRLYSNTPYAYTGKGEALLALKRFSEALESFTAALKIDLKDVNAIKGKQLAYSKLQQQSLESKEHSVQDKQDGEAKDQPLAVSAKADEKAETVAANKIHETLNTSDWEIIESPVSTVNEHEKWLAELQKQETILKQNPNDARAHYDKGEALCHLGRRDEAIVCYDIVLKINPNYAGACHGKACALFVLGRYDKAIAFYDDVLKVNPNDWLIHYYKGYALKSLNRYDDAITSYDASLRLYSNTPYAYTGKGEALLALKRFSEALESFTAALKIDLKDVNAIKGKQLAYSKLQQQSLESKEHSVQDKQDGEAKEQALAVSTKADEKLFTPPEVKVDSAVATVGAVASSPPTSPVSTELVTWMQELKSNGLELTSWQAFGQQMQDCKTAGISFTDIKHAIIQLQTQLMLIDQHLLAVNQELELDPDAKAEQEYINKHSKLLNYQRKIQQELIKFIVAYSLGTTGIYTLEPNKIGMILNALGDAPMVGTVLKVVIKGFQFANTKYEAYRTNRLTELFHGIKEVEHAILRFSRQLTLAKEEKIQEQITVTRSGVTGRLQGIYEAVKDTIYEQWHSLKLSDSTGLDFKGEERLALLDAAFLVESILSGETVIKAQDLAVVPFLLRAVLKDSTYEHHTPPKVRISLTAVSTTPAVTTVAPAAPAERPALSMVESLHQVFVRKGIRDLGAKEAEARDEKIRTRQVTVAMPAVENKREREEKKKEEKQTFQRDLTVQTVNKQVRIQERRDQLHAYLIQCDREQKFFQEQSCEPVLYFKLAFSSMLNELFMRCYLMFFNPNMHHRNTKVAIREEEARNINRLIAYVCPDISNLQSRIELLSKFIARRMALIYQEKLLGIGANRIAVDQFMKDLLQQLKVSFSKTISCTPKLKSEFNDFTTCVNYLLNCYVEDSAEQPAAKKKAKEKIEAYLLSHDEKEQNISFTIKVTAVQHVAGVLPNGTLFSQHRQVSVQMDGEHKSVQGQTMVALTQEQVLALQGLLAAQGAKTSDKCTIM